MSQTLYRKYRSQRFSELVGQDTVTRILRNSIARERLNHAYLFSGPRGTGKTSVARIFAKALNCQHTSDGDACGKCEVCTAVAQGIAPDVIEIDAASNRGVHEIKDALIDRVAYAPLEFKYKVYIIDEVHMLSGTAFNSMLKTLEEPPGHVIFCLCTTEPHKLPVTIHSRCIRFDFHLLPLKELATHLMWIAGEEGFELHADAARELAELSGGSARDAISLLDQLLVFCEREITTQAINQLFQLGDPTLPPRAADLLAAGDPQPLIALWDELVKQGADAGQFLLQLGVELKTRYLKDQRDGWRRALEAVWQGVNLLKFESFPAVLVELTLLKAQFAFQDAATPQARQSTPPAAAPQPAPQTAKPRERNTDPDPERRVEPAIARPVAPQPPSQPSAPVPAAPLADESQAAVPVNEEWAHYLAAVKARQTTTYALLFRHVSGDYHDGKLAIEFARAALPAFRFIQNEGNKQVLVAAAVELYGSAVGVILKLEGDERSAIDLAPVAAAVVREQEDLPPELLSDATAENSIPVDAQRQRGPGFDPSRMTRAAEDMASEISADTQLGEDEEKPDVGFITTLFDGQEIEDEEGSHER